MVIHEEVLEQILDLLLSLNETARIPAPLRYDLRTLAETDPSLPTGLNPEPIQQRLHELRADLTNGIITPEEYAQNTENLHNSHQLGPMIALAKLEATAPHTVNPPDPPVDGIDLTDAAPGYLSPTHEEEITAMVANAVHSHKELPLRLYQVGRKYRDEARPRQGLLRGREFVMKDLYTFDSSDEAARDTYEAVRAAYRAFLDELNLPYLEANADSGNMGASRMVVGE